MSKLTNMSDVTTYKVESVSVQKVSVLIENTLSDQCVTLKEHQSIQLATGTSGSEDPAVAGSTSPWNLIDK